MENYKLLKPGREDFDQLLQVWESSVRATHHFLGEEDIARLKQMIIDMELFGQVDISCLSTPGDKILAFIGVAHGNIEMLFVHADHIGRGIGRTLLLHAIEEAGVTKVDVNEQNEQAVEFYRKFGFKTISRSELDGQGNPFPVLHMELI